MKFLIRTFSVVSVILLLVSCAQSSGGGQDYRDEVGANGLLTPRAIFARYVDAIGGETVIRSHTSTTINGRFVLAAFGMEGSATIHSRAPNHVAQIIELPGLGEIQNGYNGDIGWTVDPLQGNSLLEGDALTDLLQNSDYYLPLNLGLSPGLVTEEIVTNIGDDAYKVKLTDERGKDSFLFFDVSSNLLVRSDAVASTPLGEIPVTTYLSDYESYDGYLQPSRLTISQAGQEFSIEVDSIEFDSVSDGDFEPPSEIQALLQ
jgi:hypothetical protein